ncbi:MAG TPA: hypothetical protein VHA75_12230, partial [Rugosimonospora sp.]|nr:hypothetical protein [Rugosimonospora sp.]
MSDQYYGYTPEQLPSYVAQYQDYSYGVTMPTYVPTAWDDYNRTNIDSMWEWMSQESDERVTAVADMWRRVYTLLEVTADHLRAHTDALAQKWTSDAAKNFTQEVGRALYSMDEWGQVALSNALALDLIASSVKGNQYGAKRVYEEYVQAYNHPGSVPGSEPKVTGGGRGGAIHEKEDDRKERMRKEYTPKIKPYVKQVADTYMDVFFNYLGRGSEYKGPTNAVYTDPKKLIPPGGGGGLPSPGSLPTPDFSKALTASLRAATASQLPDALTLAGGQTTPTLPHPGLPSPGLPGPGVPNPPAGPPGLPGLPGLPPPAENVSFPGRPRGGGLPPEEGSGRPSLPGGRPNLSGRQPPRAGRPPASRGGTPNLRGSRGRLPGGGLPESAGLAEELEHPNARAPLPPRLSGRRTPTEGTRRGPGAPGEEQFPHTAPPRGRALGERGSRGGLRRGAAGPGGEETPRPGLPRGRSGEPGERLSGRRGPGGPVEEQEAFRRGLPERPDLSGRTRPRA